VLRVVPPGEGDVIGSAPDRRVELLCDHDAVHVTWSRFGPDRPGADLHVHRRHTDVFYVLDGELVLLLGAEGEPVTVPAGTLARMPPGVVHGFRAGARGVRYLNLHAPGSGFAAYLHALRDGRPGAYDQEPPPADGGRPPGDAVVGGGEVLPGRPGVRSVLLANLGEVRIEEVWMEPVAGAPVEPRGGRGIRGLHVLDGEVTVAAGAREVRAPAGTWLQVPAGVARAIAPVGRRPVRVLDVLAPGVEPAR